MAGPVWPIHPHPLPDELLSSWMIRIARGNGYKVQSFYASYFGRDRQIWNRDIDHHAPDWLIEALSERTTIRIERIRRMTLRAYEGTVFEEFQERAVTRFVMSLSIYHRTRRAYGQQFCPVCLDEDQQPYLRRCWRLALLTVCSKHLVVLQDRCGNCGKPIVPHRADMSTRHTFPARLDMRTCGFCRGCIAAVPEAADGNDVLMQRSIEEILQCGYVRIGNNQNLYAHLYFDGLRALMHGVRRLGVVTPSHHNFDRCDVLSRLALMREASKLLQDWPDHFLRFCDHVHQPYTTFCRDGYLPYWIYSVMRAHFWQAGASIPTLQSTIKKARSAEAAASQFRK